MTELYSFVDVDGGDTKTIPTTHELLGVDEHVTAVAAAAAAAAAAGGSVFACMLQGGKPNLTLVI